MLPFWIAASFSGDASPSCESRHDGFMERWRLTPFGCAATQASCWHKCQPSSCVRLEAYGFVGLSAGA
jgi:hypothetical protein